ncbi:sugar kinase [Anaerobacillus alkaliphilus]|uniref:Sugar kinase n=1 Tax=Anaerobacillus alkaliphilus TaxID=1548597 RepID=A0A4Q0VWW0_9BACI|nr:sugar kinase [Anaerobacillus alkaliphilus]RXJ02068.1 sugar kinase [Anaerobacillus alkaliphilus]
MDVVTIGETMVVLTPESSPLMRYAHSYSRKFGGAETNVAFGLTRLGHQVGWISKVGDDEFGKSLLSFVRGEGVDVSEVKLEKTAQTGLYFKEVRSGDNVRVQYYRKGSAASTMSPSDLNEAYIAKAKYLHITGITPALSESCYETIIRVIEIAKANGLKIVFDPNLRKKLWSEEQARKVLLEIAALADIILPGVDEGTFMFGETDPETLGQLFLDQGAQVVILKTGAKGAYYFTKDEMQFVPGFKVKTVIDPVGAGDGFAAGVISGLLDELPLEEVVKRANAVGALATQVVGDFEGLPDREELRQFMCEPTGEDISR